MNIENQLQNSLEASRTMSLLSAEKINDILLDVANAAIDNIASILLENEKDLAKMDEQDPKFDRLKLSVSRIQDIAADIRNVVKLPSPLGKIISEQTLENNLNIKRVSVAFGVIGIIYEARPNVTFDVFSLCLKSGNACVLKGGSDAEHSNQAIVKVIHEVLKEYQADPNIITLLPPDREATTQLLHARKYIDLLIPRGSQGLINFVRENASIPVIETGAGICHTYIDEHADVIKAENIIFNAKCRRPSVCNSLDCVIVHENSLANLSYVCMPLIQKNVIIYADEPAYAILQDKYPDHLLEHATEESFGTEFLDYKLAIKTVSKFSEALAHIAEHGSKHSEAIISENNNRLELFRKLVDAAAVYCNASTAFTDGAQFGLGAEIGISTQKLHARGPMALEELTSYKWLINGNGQTRDK